MGGANKPPGMTEGGDVTKTNGTRPSGWQVGETITGVRSKVSSIPTTSCTCGLCIFCKEKNKINKPK